MNNLSTINKNLVKQLLTLVIGVTVTLPLFFSKSSGDIFTLHNGLRGDKFNYALIALIGIVFVISSTRELCKIAIKRKRRSHNTH